MAQIAIKMQAVGSFADERCTGCARQFERGDQMNGINYDDGEPAGWFCEVCVAYWRELGKPPEPKEVEDGAQRDNSG